MFVSEPFGVFQDIADRVALSPEPLFNSVLHLLHGEHGHLRARQVQIVAPLFVHIQQ